MVVIDRSITSIKGSGVYLIQVGEERELRRVQPLVDGTYDIRVDNVKRYASEPAEGEKLVVYGKVLASLTMKIIR